MLISDVMVGALGGAAMVLDWGGGRETTIFSALSGLMGRQGAMC